MFHVEQSRYEGELPMMTSAEFNKEAQVCRLQAMLMEARGRHELAALLHEMARSFRSVARSLEPATI